MTDVVGEDWEEDGWVVEAGFEGVGGFCWVLGGGEGLGGYGFRRWMDGWMVLSEWC